MSAGKSEVVAWMLRRKSDGFVRAIYANEPSPETFAIAEMEGDEYVRMAPESLLLDARAEIAVLQEQYDEAGREWLFALKRAERAEALAGERLALLVEYRNAPKFGDDKTIRATIAIEDRIDAAIDAVGGRGER